MLKIFSKKIYSISFHTGMTQKDQGMTQKDPSWLQKMRVLEFFTKETLLRTKLYICRILLKTLHDINFTENSQVEYVKHKDLGFHDRLYNLAAILETAEHSSRLIVWCQCRLSGLAAGPLCKMADAASLETNFSG